MTCTAEVLHASMVRWILCSSKIDACSKMCILQLMVLVFISLNHDPWGTLPSFNLPSNNQNLPGYLWWYEGYNGGTKEEREGRREEFDRTLYATREMSGLKLVKSRKRSTAVNRKVNLLQLHCHILFLMPVGVNVCRRMEIGDWIKHMQYRLFEICMCWRP